MGHDSTHVPRKERKRNKIKGRIGRQNVKEHLQQKNAKRERSQITIHRTCKINMQRTNGKHCQQVKWNLLSAPQKMYTPVSPVIGVISSHWPVFDR